MIQVGLNPIIQRMRSVESIYEASNTPKFFEDQLDENTSTPEQTREIIRRKKKEQETSKRLKMLRQSGDLKQIEKELKDRGQNPYISDFEQAYCEEILKLTS